MVGCCELVMNLCVPKKMINFLTRILPSFTGAYSPGRTFGLHFGFSWSHTYRHTVRLLWTSDQPVAEASTYTGQHNRQTSMPRAGFKPATPATKRPQTYALDCAASGMDSWLEYLHKFSSNTLIHCVIYNKTILFWSLFISSGRLKISSTL
jgi:hypothetical protein